ncbi:MAG: VOC family protein [Acidobacteria bacterium]|nr:VOC family protein [Acidobacteriota bacterium]
MSRIYHIALKVEDVEKSKAFYKELFGFAEVKQARVRDHVSCHLSDGNIHLALIQYDSEDAPEAGLSGPGPCIHHFGIEVDDLDEARAKIEEMGCVILTDPGVLPIKFRTPDGIVAEISPPNYFEKYIKGSD